MPSALHDHKLKHECKCEADAACMLREAVLAAVAARGLDAPSFGKFLELSPSQAARLLATPTWNLSVAWRAARALGLQPQVTLVTHT